MRCVLGFGVSVLLAVALGTAGCGGDDRDGDADAFCARLDRLTRNDPFLAFGDRATPEDIGVAFGALVAQAADLADLAPPDARAAARDYARATTALDALLAEADYVGTQVDADAYGDEQRAYVAAAQRLERYLTAAC